MILHLLVLVGLLNLINSLSCNEEESCAWINVIDGDDSSSVLCRGYSSCLSSPLIEISHNPSGSIWCNGAKSCYNSSIIRRTMIKSFVNTPNSTTAIFENPNENVIYCNGMASCAFVKHLENKNGSIDCNGQYSCANSVIIINTGVLLCQGSHSCQNSTIMVSGEASVNIYGYMAAHNAVLYSTGTNAFFTFQGLNSAEPDGATIVCGDNHECTVDCRGSGCDNLKVICNSSIHDCTIDKKCVAAYDGGDINICSDNVKSYKLLDESSILFKNLTTSVAQYLDQSYMMSASGINSNSCSVGCNDVYSCANGSWSGWNVGNYSTYTNDIILQDYKNGPICCNAEQSCIMAQNLSTWNVSSQRLGAAIFCDGERSCTDIDEYIIAKKRGNIYIRGGNLFGSGDYQFKVATSTNNNIFCTALGACRDYTLIQSDNVFCTARDACAFDAQITNVNNIWVVVAFGAYHAKFADINNNVYCIAHRACWRSTIENVQGLVIGLHDAAMESASLVNVAKVLCDGPYACQNATFVNVKHIQSNGIDCLSSYVHFFFWEVIKNKK